MQGQLEWVAKACVQSDKDRDSTTTLGNLLQCVATVLIKKIFMFKLNLLVFN